MKAANDKEKLPRTRAEAMAAGAKHYFTGKQCKYGHDAPRYANDGCCMECARVKALQKYYDNWEENKERSRQYMNSRYAGDQEFRQKAKAKQKEPKVIEQKKAYSKIKRANRSDEEKAQQREYMRKYQLERCRKSPRARLNRAISGGIYKSIIEGSKAGRKWERLVGYTIVDLMRHLEARFTDEMSWENYGSWHIDHEIPKSAFNYETPEDIDFQRCWALENLKSMWAAANISKGKKLTRPFQPSLLIATNDNRQAPLKETA